MAYRCEGCGRVIGYGHEGNCPKIKHELPFTPPYFNENRFLVVDVSHPKAMEAVRELLNKTRKP